MDRGVTRITCYYHEHHRILVMCLSNCITTCNDHVRRRKSLPWAITKCKSPAKYIRSPPDIRVNLTDLSQPPTTQHKISDRLLCTTRSCTLSLPPNITLTLPILSLTNLTPAVTYTYLYVASPPPGLPSCPHQPISSLTWLGSQLLSSRNPGPPQAFPSKISRRTPWQAVAWARVWQSLATGANKINFGRIVFAKVLSLWVFQGYYAHYPVKNEEYVFTLDIVLM
jgi:hypothetical protein